LETRNRYAEKFFNFGYFRVETRSAFTVMSKFTVALTESMYQQLASSLNDDRETAYVAILGEVKSDDSDNVTTCIRSIVPVSESCYLERTPNHLLISSNGFMPVISEAAKLETGAGFVHTHPNGKPNHSSLDDDVDAELTSLVSVRTGGHSYLSLIVAGTVSHPELAGRSFSPVGECRWVDAFRIVGERLLVVLPKSASEMDDSDSREFDRQIRAFGALGQSVLHTIRVGIAGAGGTGSAVCEQLVRLGVRDIILIDDDVISESNVSRIYGSTATDVGRYKAEVVAQHANSIHNREVVTPVIGRVSDQAVARTLRHCDVLFGCTDDQIGRSVLSRMAYWYLMLYIDMGVVVTSNNAVVSEIFARVTTVGPGSACLLCRGRIQSDIIRAESLPSSERERLQQEGYVPGLPDSDPSVVTYTSLVASLATSEFLNRLFGFVRDGFADEFLARIDYGEIRKNRAHPQDGHYCADPHEWGAGDQEPFLGQLWI
jgi:hypothetical protein